MLLQLLVCVTLRAADNWMSQCGGVGLSMVFGSACFWYCSIRIERVFDPPGLVVFVPFGISEE
jgi:hypothetical protein